MNDCSSVEIKMFLLLYVFLIHNLVLDIIFLNQDHTFLIEPESITQNTPAAV